MSTVSEAARKQTRYKEISDERKAIEEQIAQLEERDSALNREQLELLGAEFSDGKTTKRGKRSAADEPIGLVPTDKDKAEKKPRKPRSDKGTKVPAVLTSEETGGVYPNVGTLDDVKASVLAFLRRNPGVSYKAHELAQELQINGGLVSKALLKLDVLKDGERRGKVYWVEAEPAQADEQVDDEQAVDPS